MLGISRVRSDLDGLMLSECKNGLQDSMSVVMTLSDLRAIACIFQCGILFCIVMR